MSDEFSANRRLLRIATDSPIAVTTPATREEAFGAMLAALKLAKPLLAALASVIASERLFDTYRAVRDAILAAEATTRR
jgi:hypothetical protein